MGRYLDLLDAAEISEALGVTAPGRELTPPPVDEEPLAIIPTPTPVPGIRRKKLLQKDKMLATKLLAVKYTEKALRDLLMDPTLPHMLDALIRAKIRASATGDDWKPPKEDGKAWRPEWR